LGYSPVVFVLAEIIQKRLAELTKVEVPIGYLDATFYRDDFRRRDTPAKASETRVDFVIEGKSVILIDDVLFTGRTVRGCFRCDDCLWPAGESRIVGISRSYAHARPTPLLPIMWANMLTRLSHSGYWLN
jgi:pyrimidine operon attenuation protein/uracil phosphoribosyltransferase